MTYLCGATLAYLYGTMTDLYGAMTDLFGTTANFVQSSVKWN